MLTGDEVERVRWRGVRRDERASERARVDAVERGRRAEAEVEVEVESARARGETEARRTGRREWVRDGSLDGGVDGWEREAICVASLWRCASTLWLVGSWVWRMFQAGVSRVGGGIFYAGSIQMINHRAWSGNYRLADR